MKKNQIFSPFPEPEFKLTKRQLTQRIYELQKVCEFLIEKIQPEDADGLMVVAAPDGHGYEWKPKENKI